MKCLVLGLGALLAGCASLAAPAPEPVRPVVVQSDTFCRIARVIQWSKRDTAATIDAIRKANARYRSACGRTRS